MLTKENIYILVILLSLSACGGSHARNNTSSENQPWYHPSPLVTWQWQLQGEINTNYTTEIYDIDLYDTPKTVIQSL